jgi:Spy/CpxP family protein refolding chaperone
MRKLAGLILLVLSSPCLAASPYAGQEQRPIKALSEKEVQDTLEGKGMGLAKAAELNHYPGPLHVLELAEKLGLSAAQKKQTQEIFAAMQKDAKRLGLQLVEKERALDQQFASGAITPDRLQALLTEIGGIQSRLRNVHLRAHLDQRKILTDEQVRRYDDLRGYGAGGSGHDHAGHSH